MILDRIKKYHQTLDVNFHFQYAELLKNESETSLHAFRLNLKKQLAFFNLLASLDENFPLDELRKTYRAYMKKTSKLRDLEVEQKIIVQHEKKFKLGNRFSRHLQAEGRYRKALLREFEEGHSILPLREARDTVADRLRHLEAKADCWLRLSNYFLGQLDLLRRAAESAVAEREEHPLHDLRTQVKELMLNLSLLEQLVPRKKRLKKIRGLLDGLQESLGDWHDRYNSLAKVQAEKNLASKILEKTLAEEKTESLEQTLALLGSFDRVYGESLAILHELFSRPPQSTGSRLKKNSPPKYDKGKKQLSFPQKNLGEIIK
jgi:hypothetical protein